MTATVRAATATTERSGGMRVEETRVRFRKAVSRSTYSFWAEQARATMEPELRGYFAWRDRIMPDPWASGAGSSNWPSGDRVKHSQPAGGYGPGSCADPAETLDERVRAVHAAVVTLRLDWLALLEMRYGVPSMTIEQQMARLGRGHEWVSAQWQDIHLALYDMLFPNNDAWQRAEALYRDERPRRKEKAG